VLKSTVKPVGIKGQLHLCSRLGCSTEKFVPRRNFGNVLATTWTRNEDRKALKSTIIHVSLHFE
jgi:hypothetical protein